MKGSRDPEPTRDTAPSTSVSCAVPRSTWGRAVHAALSRRAVSRTVTGLVRPAARWLPIDVLGRVPVVGNVDVGVPGAGRRVTMWTDGLDGVAAILYWRGLEGWEPETVAVLLPLARRSSVVLDAGANVGLHTLLMAAGNPAATVHAFEPVARVCARLRRNIELNALANVRVHEMALSNEEGLRPMHVPPFAVPVEASADPGFGRGGEVAPVTFSTLDGFVAAHDLDPVDLVKIDTEGTEHLVMQGAVATLRRHRPFVVAEVLPGQPPEAAFGPLLRGLDYVAFHLTERGAVRREAVAGDLRFKNWLFCPAERIEELPPHVDVTDAGAS
jgi:FkbM family methyltransferase